MRVLVANHTTKRVGGAEEYISAVLPALESEGANVRVLTEDESALPLSSHVWLSRGPRVRDEIREWGPQVVFTQGLFDPDLEEWLVTSFPSVLFAHNYYGTCISGEKRHRRPRLQFCQRRLGRVCLALYFTVGCGPAGVRGFVSGYAAQRRRHDLLPDYREILVGSGYMKAEFERNTKTKVTIAPLFSSPPAASPSSERVMNRFAFVGRMTAVKGGDLALNACAQLQATTGEPVTLDLVGDGPERPGWERLAGTLHVTAKFHGWLGSEARDALVSRACALILPSVWPEPFGLVGLEAARLGVPTVAYEVGGIADWLTDGVSGALCPVQGDLVASLERGLHRAREDLKGRRTWGAEAHRTSHQFSAEKHVRVLREVFTRLSGAQR
jgi:glycosyltransferase involved in cell wall biosynthesis